MDLSDDLVTIEAAGRRVGIPPSAIGYWIVTGQLQSKATTEGRLVGLSAVRSLATTSNLPTLRETTPPVSNPQRDSAAAGQDHASRPESLQTTIRLARIERRMTELDEILGELRDLMRVQNDTIVALRDLLQSAVPIATPVVPEPSPPAPNPRAEEPLLTIRLRRASESIEGESTAPIETTSRLNPHVENLRLTRDPEPPTTSQPRTVARPRLADPTGELA